MPLIPNDICDPNIIKLDSSNSQRESSNFGAPFIEGSNSTLSAGKLAAEGLSHLTEGWKYLSAASNSLLSNAEDQAIHFAYYAELRAVFSIFSYHGIRINYPNHSYLNNNNVSINIWNRQRTHNLTWQLWKEWSLTSYAENLLLDYIKINPSINLRDVYNSIGLNPVQTILQNLGLDLMVKSDHIARNNSSYEPKSAREKLSKFNHQYFSFLLNMWKMSTPNGFGLQIDVQLATFFLMKHLKEVDKIDRYNTLKNIISRLENQTGQNRNTILQSLKFSKNISFINLALSDKTGVRNIMSRAFLLLRLATICTQRSARNSNNQSTFQWLEDWLTHSGLIHNNISCPTDIWSDFSDIPNLPILPVPLPILPTANLDKIGKDVLLMSRPDAVLAWSCTS